MSNICKCCGQQVNISFNSNLRKFKRALFLYIKNANEKQIIKTGQHSIWNIMDELKEDEDFAKWGLKTFEIYFNAILATDSNYKCGNWNVSVSSGKRFYLNSFAYCYIALNNSRGQDEQL